MIFKVIILIRSDEDTLSLGENSSNINSPQDSELFSVVNSDHTISSVDSNINLLPPTDKNHYSIQINKKDFFKLIKNKIALEVKQLYNKNTNPLKKHKKKKQPDEQNLLKQIQDNISKNADFKKDIKNLLISCYSNDDIFEDSFDDLLQRKKNKVTVYQQSKIKTRNSFISLKNEEPLAAQKSQRSSIEKSTNSHNYKSKQTQDSTPFYTHENSNGSRLRSSRIEQTSKTLKNSCDRSHSANAKCITSLASQTVDVVADDIAPRNVSTSTEYNCSFKKVNSKSINASIEPSEQSQQKSRIDSNIGTTFSIHKSIDTSNTNESNLLMLYNNRTSAISSPVQSFQHLETQTSKTSECKDSPIKKLLQSLGCQCDGDFTVLMKAKSIATSTTDLQITKREESKVLESCTCKGTAQNQTIKSCECDMKGFTRHSTTGTSPDNKYESSFTVDSSVMTETEKKSTRKSFTLTPPLRISRTRTPKKRNSTIASKCCSSKYIEANMNKSNKSMLITDEECREILERKRLKLLLAQKKVDCLTERLKCLERRECTSKPVEIKISLCGGCSAMDQKCKSNNINYWLPPPPAVPALNNGFYTDPRIVQAIEPCVVVPEAEPINILSTEIPRSRGNVIPLNYVKGPMVKQSSSRSKKSSALRSLPVLKHINTSGVGNTDMHIRNSQYQSNNLDFDTNPVRIDSVANRKSNASDRRHTNNSLGVIYEDRRTPYKSSINPIFKNECEHLFSFILGETYFGFLQKQEANRKGKTCEDVDCRKILEGVMRTSGNLFQDNRKHKGIVMGSLRTTLIRLQKNKTNYDISQVETSIPSSKNASKV